MSDKSMSQEEKGYYRKRLVRNIVQLFFGTVLLLLAYVHLQHNNAEKMSISSGVEVLSQKVVLWFHNMFDHNGTQYEDKLSMEKNYAEVINVVQNSSCKDKVDLGALTIEYKNLQAESVDHYVAKRTEYNKFLVDFYRKVSDVCKAEVHTQTN